MINRSGDTQVDLDASEPVINKSGDIQVDLERLEAKNTWPFDPDQHEVDMSKCKVTSWVQNARVHLPRAVKPGIEAELRVRKDTYSETFEMFKQQNCTGEGNQRSNLNKDQRMGLQSLQKKIKENQVVICKSDKTSKLIAVHPDIYQKMGEDHVKGDIQICKWEIHCTQKGLNQHTATWLKMLRMGDQWGHRERFRETCLNKTASVPSLSLLIKDHKQVKLGEVHKTRSVCGSQG